MDKKIYLDIKTKEDDISSRINEELKDRNSAIREIVLSIPKQKNFDKTLLQNIEDEGVFVYYHSDLIKQELDQIIITFLEQDNFNIAIDGPSGSGKSTIAKALASVLDIDYLDTGAMYRAVTYILIKNNINLYEEEVVCSFIKDIVMEIKNKRIFMNNEDVQDFLRDQIVTKNVSLISSYQCVRNKLVELQRLISREQSSILDGRDIGTVVFPHAKYKFYLNADVEIRAQRRYEETKEDVSYEEILADIIKRDEYDKNRKISPLRKAADAIEIDSSSLTIAGVIDEILKHMRSRV